MLAISIFFYVAVAAILEFVFMYQSRYTLPLCGVMISLPRELRSPCDHFTERAFTCVRPLAFDPSFWLLQQMGQAFRDILLVP